MKQFTDTDETIHLGAWTATVQIEHDSDTGAPWNESDGHGSVSDWTARDKHPGELKLCDGRFYDYAAACRTALADKWGSMRPYTVRTYHRHGAWFARATAYRLPDLLVVAGSEHDARRKMWDMYRATMTRRQWAANAAMADYEYLRGWCNDEWSYVGVIVTVTDHAGNEIGTASIWGVETSTPDYPLDVANEILAEALDNAADSARATYDSERARLARAAPAMLVEITRQRKALAEANISLQAIGNPAPHDPPGAHICGVIARSCLVRIENALKGIN